MINNEDDEYKKKLEEAKQLRNFVGMATSSESDNTINYSSNSNFQQKLNEAKNLRESVGMITTNDIEEVNPDETNNNSLDNPMSVTTYVAENEIGNDKENNKEKSNIKFDVARNNAKNTVSNIRSVNKANDSTVKEDSNKSENVQQFKTAPTVTKQDGNYLEQEIKNNNILKPNSSNIGEPISNLTLSGSKEISDATDLYIASNGAIDRRSNTEKIVDMITGITGNFMEGVQDFIPSIIDYVNSGEQVIAKNNIKNGLKFLGYSEKKIDIITQKAMENYNNLSPISQLNLLINNESSQKRKDERIQTNILKASNNPMAKKIAEIAPSIGSNVVSMTLTAVNPVLGMVSFMVSAGGSYLDDARNRGMTDDEAFGYATVMGIFEGRY